MNKSDTQTAVITPVHCSERRAKRRVKVSRPVLTRPADPKYKEEVQVTLNTSRDGLYFKTRADHYRIGMRVSVVLGYSPEDSFNPASLGEVVRVDRCEDGGFGVAIQIHFH